MTPNCRVTLGPRSKWQDCQIAATTAPRLGYVNKTASRIAPAADGLPAVGGHVIERDDCASHDAR